MDQTFLDWLGQETETLKKNGLYKTERVLDSPQGAKIQLTNGLQVLNFCANNYLGLANHPKLIETAQQTFTKYGFGLSSVRFICGTQSPHLSLEKQISTFLKMDDTILFSSCFDANTGLFETLLSKEDAILSDTLNHASIIDGIRLCKAERYRYAHNDMADLEYHLKSAINARFRLIVTDGVFSMDGAFANLKDICKLAKEYNALVMVDDSHAVGLIGPGGRGTPALMDVEKDIDIITGTLGKALGGASGGYVSGRANIVAWLRQRSRPYLFSNTLAPIIAATSLKVFEILENEGEQLRSTLMENAAHFRNRLEQQGFTLLPGEHPIIPIMLGDAIIAGKMAEALLTKGIYVTSFSYPVVPKDKARIRVQISAAHTKAQLNQAIDAFHSIGKSLQVI